MKNILIIFAAVLLMGISTQQSYAQLSDEEYNYVTMDLRGILNLTMTTAPQVDFTFKTVQEYSHGITQFNAVQLEVDATLAWDLFVYAKTDNWTPVEAYSTNGNNYLPAEILFMKSNTLNPLVDGVTGQNLNTFKSLRGLVASGVANNVPNGLTQYLMGGFGLGSVDATLAGLPGTAAKNPANKFRVDYKLTPGIPATFAGSEILVGANPGVLPNTSTDDYAQAGYYYLEVVYSLIEDL